MIGVIIGVFTFAFGAWYMFANPSTEFHGFYDKPALVLLTLGPIGIIITSYGLSDLFHALKNIFSMASFNQTKQMNEIANTLTQLSQAVRTEGMGALMSSKNKIKNPLFKDGISLILASFTPEEIRHNVIAKINAKQTQLENATNIFDTLSQLSPGIGLVGTIIGLVHMLANLSDPSKIGGAMAAALLATLYGLIYANIIYKPIAEKVKLYAEKRLQLETMIMEGLLILKEKKSGVHLRETVNAYSHNPKPNDNNAANNGKNAKGA